VLDPESRNDPPVNSGGSFRGSGNRPHAAQKKAALARGALGGCPLEIANPYADSALGDKLQRRYPGTLPRLNDCLSIVLAGHFPKCRIDHTVQFCSPDFLISASLTVKQPTGKHGDA
jgi:hypothetical protein